MAIPQKHLIEVCKPNSESCCRYLSSSGSELVCEKLTSMRAFLDKRVAEGKMNATGDNCEGLSQTNETN